MIFYFIFLYYCSVPLLQLAINSLLILELFLSQVKYPVKFIFLILKNSSTFLLRHTS